MRVVLREAEELVEGLECTVSCNYQFFGGRLFTELYTLAAVYDLGGSQVAPAAGSQVVQVSVFCGYQRPVYAWVIDISMRRIGM